MKHVFIAGAAGVGKDTVAQVLIEEYGFTRMAFADPIKAALEQINPFVTSSRRLRDYLSDGGWDFAKQNPEVRRLLQNTGMAFREKVWEDIWVQHLSERIDDADGPVVVTDMRMPNEVQLARELGGAVLVRLSRAHIDTGLGWRSHISERALDGFDDKDFDLCIAGLWSPSHAAKLIAECAA